MIEKIKENKILKILLVVILLLLVISLSFAIVSKNSKKLTDLEKIKLTEVSDEISNYFEYIEESKKEDLDDYIIYALEYSYNENDKNTLKIKEIMDIIKDRIDIDIKEDSLLDVGVTPKMVDANITFDYENNSYILNVSDRSYADIAATKVIKYISNDIKKISKNEYSISYNKYVVENPYDVLNYYMDNNDSKSSKEITKYLQGEEKVSLIKKYITNKNGEKVGKKEKEITVEYIIKDNKVKIKNIK